MKRLFCLLLILALLTLPALAAEQYIYDDARLLSDGERSALESQAEQISRDYQCAVYVVTVQDFRDFGSSWIRDAAESIYTDQGFGWGEEKSGVMLLLSMKGRDYALIAYGYGNVAFTDYGKDVLKEKFLDDFKRDRWAAGLKDYVKQCGVMLKKARAGRPLDVNTDYLHRTVTNLRSQLGVAGTWIVILGLPCLIALIACGKQKKKLKSVAKAAAANAYVLPDSLDLTASSDQFSHTTQTRVRIERDSSRGGGGGGTSVSSSGFSGTSGKF